MPDSTLQLLTACSDLLVMGCALWLALYLLSRGFTNRLTFRAALLLLAVSAYALCAFIEIYKPGANTSAWRGFAVIIAVAASQHLTHYLLPPERQERQHWTARGVLVLGLVTTAFLVAGSIRRDAGAPGEALYFNPLELHSASLAYAIFVFLGSSAAIYNLVLGLKQQRRYLNRSFFAALGLGTATVIYGLAASVIRRPLPRITADLGLLGAMGLLAYSATRYRALVERRIARQDLPLTALTLFVIAAVYTFSAVWLRLSPVETALVIVLAILTHSAYGLARDFLERVLHRRESALRNQLRRLGRAAPGTLSLERSLDRGLAILYHNLGATSGFIAVRHGKRFLVTAALHSLAVGTEVPGALISVEEPRPAPAPLANEVAWLVPAFGGSRLVAVIGLGPRQGRREYDPVDLEWLEDVADRIGAMVWAFQEAQPESSYPLGGLGALDQAQGKGDHKTRSMLLHMARPVDPQLVGLVEDGLRHLHDYIHLGRSELGARLPGTGGTHIEVGKALQQLLVETIETLRPIGDPPAEPLPKEWYSYAILHGAYVEDVPDREIMARLYVSESTFYRYRRKALRGVARALLEGGGLN